MCSLARSPAHPGTVQFICSIDMESVTWYIVGSSSPLVVRSNTSNCYTLCCLYMWPVRDTVERYLLYFSHCTIICLHSAKVISPSYRLLYTSCRSGVLILPRIHTMVFVFLVLMCKYLLAQRVLPLCQMPPGTGLGPSVG